MSILEKVLAALLALALGCGFGALWYADHERARAALATQNAESATKELRQAEANVNSAIAAASDARAQLRSASDAAAAAQRTAAVAIADANAARSKLAKVANAPVLEASVPGAVWDAIFKKGE